MHFITDIQIIQLEIHSAFQLLIIQRRIFELNDIHGLTLSNNNTFLTTNANATHPYETGVS